MALTFKLEPDPSGEPGELVIRALEGEEERGRVLFDYSPGAYTAKLRTVFVDPDARKKGIAHTLMIAAVTAVKAGGAKRIEAYYNGYDETTAAAVKLLDKAGFSRPADGIVLIRANTKRMLESPWSKLEPPEGYQVFPWRELPKADLDQLETEDWYDKELGPFTDEPFEPLNSVGARDKDGHVVGWMLTTRYSADTLKYGRLFVHPKRRASTLPLVLVMEAVRMQDQEPYPQYGNWAVKSENRAARRLFEKRLAPFIISVSESRYAELLLKD